MLATDICQPVRFDPWVTAGSVVPSVIASAIGLRVFIDRWNRPLAIVGAGLCLGAGIGAMHYTGMSAMRMQSSLAYDPLLFVASLVVAVTLAIGALACRQLLSNHTRWPRWLIVGSSGAILGLAISGMHYMAMASAVFVGPLDTPFLRGSGRHLELASIIASIAVAIFGCAWGVVGIATYQHLARRFKERGSLLQDILDHIPSGIIRLSIMGNEYHRVLASTSLEHLLGRSAQAYQAGQWSLFDAIGAHDVEAAHELLRAAIEQGQTKSATIQMLTAEGQRRWVDVRVHARKVRPDHTVVDLYLTDITAQHLSRREQAELVQAIDQLIGRALLSTDGYFLDVNPPLSASLGYNPTELLGQHHRLIWHESQDGESMRQFWEDLRHGQARSGEFVRRAKDGSARHLVGWYQPLIDPASSQVRAILKLAIDRTERARYLQELVQKEAQLRQAMESRSAFFANVSHEIRTPMNAIVGYARLLAETLAPGPAQQQAQAIVDASGSLLRILNDLLDAAKLERGEFSIVEAPFGIHALAHGLISQFGAIAGAKGLDLRLHIEEHLPTRWLGDADRIRQMLANLLGNAIKFTQAGHVSLSIGLHEGALLLQVDDSGIGIAADRQQAIFEPFVQADSGTSRRYGGTGLGMSIVKGLCERMGGRIELHSQPGQGTTVRLHLPLTPLPEEDPGNYSSSRSSEAQRPILPRLRLLCVDDVAQNRDLLQTLLARSGHTACIVASGQELLARYRQDPGAWDAVLLDLQMPELDGFDTCRLLRDFECEQGLPAITVLALSASVMDNDRRKAQASGMNGFLEKPINVDALHEALARVAHAPLDRPTAAQGDDASSPPPAVVDERRGTSLWGQDWRPQVRRWVRQTEAEWPQRQHWGHAQWHRIAGVAANLALPALTLAARQAERSAAQGHDVDLTLIDHAWDELRTWLQRHDPLAPEPAAQTPSGPVVSTEDAPRWIDRLEKALQRGQIDDDALEALCALGSGHAHALRQACETFDFDAALQTLTDWRSALEPKEARS
ncbi:ATP-binding protein [Caldimonas sp.]|uniref:ATP-binding protein n=1 Tax=Caldimonas sp. TaxID=2838790 RepID=UPI00391A1DD9